MLKMFPLVHYCASAFSLVGCRAMAECHVQLVHNALIGFRTLNLRFTSTLHHPVEQLTFLNCMKPHSHVGNVY